MLNRILKVTLSTTAVLVALFLVIANFSEKEQRYECSGSTTGPQARADLKLYLKATEFRWWVKLWSESRGAVWIELPREFAYSFSHVRISGDKWDIYNDSTSRQLKGEFSTLSRALALEVGQDVFEGQCRLLGGDAVAK
jgi:hypothetical protein